MWPECVEDFKYFSRAYIQYVAVNNIAVKLRKLLGEDFDIMQNEVNEIIDVHTETLAD